MLERVSRKYTKVIPDKGNLVDLEKKKVKNPEERRERKERGDEEVLGRKKD